LSQAGCPYRGSLASLLTLMFPTSQGSFKLFKFSGIQVYLHWSWLLVAFYQIEQRKNAYASPGWNVAEYLILFLIVLMHEFGHSFASRQVGGHSDTIVLWPFGGVAWVSAPQRSAAQLWSIAAGPLVNVALFVPLTVVLFLSSFRAMEFTSPNAFQLMNRVWEINFGLLVFNMLPIFPLDGGQILRSLLWFFIGPLRSLNAACITGLIGISLLVAYLLLDHRFSLWMGLLAYLIGSSCWSSLQQARAASQQARGLRS
jgi:Zn-dependent protease